MSWFDGIDKKLNKRNLKFKQPKAINEIVYGHVRKVWLGNIR